jgi:hypothetical protein
VGVANGAIFEGNLPQDVATDGDGEARAGSPNSLARRRASFVVALALLACGEQLCGAQSMPVAPDRADASTGIRGPPIQDPRELEHALLSDDSAEAARLFWRFSCAQNAESAEVVRHVWEERDSSGASGAVRDPLVRTQMAKCLAAAWPRFRPTEPGDAPVLAQLRRSMASSNLEEVRAAAFGLTQIATAEDVQSMVAAAARLPALASQMTADLTQVCRVDAIEAERTIGASVTDARQHAEIQEVESHAATLRRTLCGFDANIVGGAVSQEDVEDFLTPGRLGTIRSAHDIEGILASTNVREAREVLWRPRCTANEKDVLDVVQKAWQHRDSSLRDSVTRDSNVRVLMARCLADASVASKSRVPAAAVEELRQAVLNGDAGNFIVGMEGLTRIATAGDLRLIESVVKNRPPVLSSIAVMYLTRSCAPGAQHVVAEIREHTSQPRALREIDYQIGATERVREFACAKREGGGK